MLTLHNIYRNIVQHTGSFTILYLQFWFQTFTYAEQSTINVVSNFQCSKNTQYTHLEEWVKDEHVQRKRTNT